MDDNRQKLIKTLRDLEYRIQVTPENDPERAAAIRLRDRLLEKHGLTLADIEEHRETYEMDRLVFIDAIIVCQFYMHEYDFKLTDRNEPHRLSVYKNTATISKKNHRVTIDLTADEHAHTWKRMTALLDLWQKQRKAFDKQMAQETERRRNAFKFEFCNKADILVKSSDDKTDHMAPGFGLKEQMEAAAYWCDIVMPNNYVEAERKAIEGPRG